MCSVDLYPSSIPWLSLSFATSDSYTYIQVNLFFSSSNNSSFCVCPTSLCLPSKEEMAFSSIVVCLMVSEPTTERSFGWSNLFILHPSGKKSRWLSRCPKEDHQKKIFPPSAWNDPHDGTITVSCLPVYVQGSCKMNFYVCVHTHIVVATTEFFKIFPMYSLFFFLTF